MPTTETALGRNYILYERIGIGSTGTVFRGASRGANLDLAIKVLRPELSQDADVVARFVQERTILTRLSSPHVVRVLDLVVEGDTLALVMEVVRGPSLRQVLSTVGTIGPESAVPLLVRVLEGLHVAHVGGVVHRDVKPANILLNLDE